MQNNSQNKKIEKVAVSSENIENENLQKLRSVFPNFVKDGVIDFDALQAFLKTEGILAGDEKYGLSWAGKNNAFRAIRAQATGTLIPQERESKNWDKTENLFIEGDNLEVLKLLQKKYRGSIKMIYIDPPYNTGKDFVYKDNFTKGVADYYEQTGQTKNGVRMTTLAEKNGRYHSDWLTMMYPRLFLGSNLLEDDGVIFVSIDDNELANLRLVMDEIFGEENYLNIFGWINNLKGRQISGVGAAKTYEYVLTYAKNIRSSTIFKAEVKKLKSLMPSSYKGFNYEAESDDDGDYVVKNELYNTNSAFNEETRPTLVFNIHYNLKAKKVKFSNVDENIQFKEFVKIEPNINNDGVHKYHAWRWSKEKIVKDIKDLKFVKVNGSAKIYTKIRDYTTTSLKDIITDITTSVGTNEVKELFDGKNLFDYPKPVDLIKLFVTQTSGNDIILDFFAGSGTTAQSVMELNAEDDVNRKWICVQLPELTEVTSEAYKAGYKNIADLARERIRRAGAKIGKGDIGFKAFTLKKSNYRLWNVLTVEDNEMALKKQIKLFADKPLVDGYDEKSVVFEVLLKEGFNLNSKVEQEKVGSLQFWKITEIDKRLFVTFASIVTQEEVGALALTDADIFVCLDSALNDTTKVNLVRNVKVKVI